MIRSAMAKLGSERNYQEYGWMILSANASLGVFAALITGLPSLYVPSSGAYPILGALGTGS